LGPAGVFVARSNINGWERELRRLLDPGEWEAASKRALTRAGELDPSGELQTWTRAVESLWSSPGGQAVRTGRPRCPGCCPGGRTPAGRWWLLSSPVAGRGAKPPRSPPAWPTPRGMCWWSRTLTCGVTASVRRWTQCSGGRGGLYRTGWYTGCPRRLRVVRWRGSGRAGAASSGVVAGLAPAPGRGLVEAPYVGSAGGGIPVLPRSTDGQVPLDRRFRGWGEEDGSGAHALTVLAGDPWRGTTPL